MPPDSGGICMGVDKRNHPFAPVLSPGRVPPGHPLLLPGPPWRQPRGKWMVSLVNSHRNATRIGWHLWEIDLRFAPELPPGRGERAPRMRALGTLSPEAGPSFEPFHPRRARPLGALSPEAGSFFEPFHPRRARPGPGPDRRSGVRRFAGVPRS